MALQFEIWVYVLVACQCFVSASFSSEDLLADLELTDLELVDICDNLSKGLRSGILKGDYSEKIIADKAYGELLKTESDNLKLFDNIPTEVERNYTFIVRPGDALLPETDWNTLVSYNNANEELETVVKIPCANGTDGCLFTKGEYESILKKSKIVDMLNTTWYSWQHVFSATRQNYTTVLNLVKKAAHLNDFTNALDYWEYLNDFGGAYSKAREFWEEIKPLYFKLHGFVRQRLNYYHKLNETEEIPVFLLGSNFGMDWSYIAENILPHPQFHFDVETFLKYKSLPEIYALADNLTQVVSLGKLGKKFWANSRFNLSFCQPQIFSFCGQEYSEVYDCDESSWTTYLNTHEAAFRIALRDQDYVSLMRLNLRYSGFDEAVAALGPLLAIESTHYHGVNSVNDPTDESVKMTKLLLAALKFLPQLPYYLAADEWRLQELEQPSDNVAASWWKMRNEYQGVKSVTGGEQDFLRDEYITSNKPYISKFFGIILAFQLIDHYRNQMSDPDVNIAFEIGNDPNFHAMLVERATMDWPYLITMNYNFDLSASPVLTYFSALEQYLDKVPKEQVPIITTTTTTTTTTVTTTTTPAPTTPLEVVVNKSEELKDESNQSIQADEPKANATVSRLNEEGVTTSSISMYAGIGLLIAVSCVCVAAFGYRHLRKRRRRTNNRRFES